MNFADFAEKECPGLVRLPGGLTLADMKAALGQDPDWPKIKADGALLQGYAQALVEIRQVLAGKVPKAWTGVHHCAMCGPVFLKPCGPVEVLACPWCINRAAGLPVPHPQKVQHAGSR